MKYKEAEKEIIKETKEFAKIHNLYYDKSIESMIVNAMREVYDLYNQVESLKNLRIRIQQHRNVGRNSNEDTQAFDVFEKDLGNIINELS